MIAHYTLKFAMDEDKRLIVSIYRDGVLVIEGTRIVIHRLLMFWKCEPAIDAVGTRHLWVRTRW